MTKELYIPRTARNGLFAVDFEVKLLLYEVRDAFFDALCRSRGLAEDYTIISIAHERVSAFLQLLVKFIENDITKEWTEWTTLRCTYIALLHYTINHCPSFQILMYQRYYSTVLDCKG